MGRSQFTESVANQIAAEIGIKAWMALLEEVCTTPKPGLVDACSTGAHKDMDIHTFMKSADALRPYFTFMARQGYMLHCAPQELFCEIRKTGMAAEQAMYRATGGVNTHKGLIFTMGIFCAAAGRCFRYGTGYLTLPGLIRVEQMMTADILKQELEDIYMGNAVSNGEKNLKKYGTTGIRGEAAMGYPAIVELALPALQRGVSDHREWNRIKIQALFLLMSRVEDSNILSRHDPKTLCDVQKEAAGFLKGGGAYAEDALDKLFHMDADYSRRNISAGGCADLLAAAIFLMSLIGTSGMLLERR